MIDLLSAFYQINPVDRKVIDGKQGFMDDEYVYFIISADDKEAIHMEQATLAYYLVENGFRHTALPIPNIHGHWMTAYEEKHYMVLRYSLISREEIASHAHGQLLAHFHHVNQTYQYEPPHISSYGKWKQLWVEKISLFEQSILEQAKKHHSHYYRLVMDIFPYLIGISENAVQYMQESERETRFNEADQGTITFGRYDCQLLKSIIWADDLVYDHPARDISEFIRKKLRQDDNRGLEESVQFMTEYLSVRPLSALSWRLLYARLVFPIDLFDVIEKAFITEDFDSQYNALLRLVDKQPLYEQNLTQFFQNTELKHEGFQLPMIEWI